MDKQQLNKVTVQDLAKYKKGDKPYWVAIRPIGPKDIVLGDEDKWMHDDDVHPKIFYERGFANGAWQFRERMPRLHAEDFTLIVNLLTSDLFIERFEVANSYRSRHTGEFLYMNTSREWIPESQLFDTITVAKREKMRIKKLIKKWSERVYDDRV